MFKKHQLPRNILKNAFLRINPGYRNRWEIYDSILDDLITTGMVWLDIGCGKNEMVSHFGYKAKIAVGIDVIDDEERVLAPFVVADIRNLPFPSGCANLITLRMVVEHLKKIPEDFSEIIRMFAPGGKLLILTTNTLSPVIFLPRLLPFQLKRRIIRKIYGVDERDIFPTYHKFNNPLKMGKQMKEMDLMEICLTEQVHLNKPLLTAIFGFWYCITELPGLKLFKSNILAVFQKIR
jgi:SAM-dependent methyltransferase